MLYVSYMDKRPCVPEHWELLPQVFLHRSFVVPLTSVVSVMCGLNVYCSQGAALRELLEDCWDSDSEARLTAHSVVERITSLQSSYSL